MYVLKFLYCTQSLRLSLQSTEEIFDLWLKIILCSFFNVEPDLYLTI